MKKKRRIDSFPKIKSIISLFHFPTYAYNKENLTLFLFDEKCSCKSKFFNIDQSS